MSRRLFVALLTLVGGTLAGCTGGNNAVVCLFDSPATLATSAWPKFRHDPQNTGTVTNPNVRNNAGRQLRRLFPKDDPPKGPFAASPVLGGGTNPPRVYIGSTDGNMYAVNPDGTQDPTFHFVSTLPITSTALVAQRLGAEALFFGGGDGQLYGLDAAGNAQVTNWPAPVAGFLSASPTIISDGTVYTASLDGFIAGVCPNGVGRFSISTGGNQSSPAVGGDPSILYYGGDDRQLRSVRNDGVILWSFSASAAILSAPVVALSNPTTTATIYVADRGGFIFAVDSTGQPVRGFTFSGPSGGPVGPMASSPALASDPTDSTAPRLYVGSDDGNLYAVDGGTGAVVWTFPTGGPIVSSPAVAVGGTNPNTGKPEHVIVVGSNDGNVYFVLDTGTAATQMAAYPIPAGEDGTIFPVRSSPAIDADGTIYVGADDGRLYAIQ